ncbi:lasso peptide biosynthesis B2 protein [Erythrobacter sp. THAF29]|uniref:lasso peptide biosynthesis B2 protein n=1 Tax=Erythrobacter sp. THAF29 TaxID=2587851 RepID=UPI001268AB58|nr:lasso peptide biosynthesis B2 protein [Erythrobacter sp. THAF29]QFT78680.1 hypothetical protein FIU90_14110 [Erythrobacter sp. THAF29]
MSVVRSIKRTVLKAEIVSGLAFARLLIKVVPFRLWRRTLGPIDGSGNATAAPLTAREEKMASDIGRIIGRLARRQKFEAVCFPQAMAGRWVLGRRGIPSQIVLGSRRDGSSELQFHAWLKVGDLVVTGQDEYETYQSFTVKDPHASGDA